jgi:hypothetical protein
MRELAVVRTENFHLFAHYNGLKLIDIPDEASLSFRLPAVKLVHRDEIFQLESMRLRNLSRVVSDIPEAVVHGRGLSTICGNALLPTGYAHSLSWLEQGGFIPTGGGASCIWPAADIVELDEDDRTFVLGPMTHFGHFFTDCLDRILTFQQSGLGPIARYLTDGEPPPQIHELLDFLGIPLGPSNLIFLDSAKDYRVRNLRVAPLGALKPAITASSFRTLRQRVLARLPAPHPAGKMLYVGRKLVPHRKVLNQEDLDRALGTMGFTNFYPELHSLAGAVGAFHGADVIVLIIGSSKFNLAFCRLGTKIVCIAPAEYVERGGAVSTMLRQICSIFSLDLCFCSSAIAGADLAIHSDIVVSADDLQRALRAVSA